jgi:hypothetical protein
MLGNVQNINFALHYTASSESFKFECRFVVYIIENEGKE